MENNNGRILFFAYGSLVNPEALAELCTVAKPLGTARIPHHALYFTGHSQRWGGATATIGLAPNTDLWGALYEIDAAGRAAIERAGGLDDYVWAFTAVNDGNGGQATAGVMCKVRNFERRPPSASYLELLQAGWEYWGLDGNRMLQAVVPAT
ncbi:MAG TPA: gamma-glutamylcyclotransferase family protein [Gemmatimonadota bacterium]|nr:gamma-glutamylcyclotransferase family protein [Gemmatimonadota bacterium]